MLKSLRIKNFRLLRDVNVEFASNWLTVFVGPNGSGKSTILEVLDFLSCCADHGLETAARAHGGIDGFRTAGRSDPVEIQAMWHFYTEGESLPGVVGLDWHLVLDRGASGAAVVRRETLRDLTNPEAPVVIVRTADDGARTVISERDVSERPSKVRSDTELAFEAVVDADRYPGLSWLNFLAGEIRVVGSLSTAPAWARTDSSGPSPRDSLVIGPQEFLGRQGVGLTNVLYSLQSDAPAAWAELERAFRSEFPFVRRIAFPADPGGSKIALAFEDARYPGRKLFASEMSDGAIAYLCLLAAILQPKQFSVLGLDEPDANLHPSALRRFMDLVQRPRPVRPVAIVTHSNALLDELHDPADSVRIVESSKDGAIVRKLDKGALDAWRKEYTLSEMRKTGLLDTPNSAQDTD
jgi:predicted ATPase